MKKRLIKNKDIKAVIPMKFEWESEKEMLMRFVKISPKQKLEWLQEMKEFTRAFLPKSKKRLAWWKLREAR